MENKMEETTEHKIVVDKNISINISIPDEMNSETFIGLLNNVNKMIKPFTKETSLYGTQPTRSYGWTEEDTDYLKENYGKIKMEEMEEKLGKTKGSIYNRAIILELTKKERKVTTVDLDKYKEAVKLVKEKGYNKSKALRETLGKDNYGLCGADFRKLNKLLGGSK